MTVLVAPYPTRARRSLAPEPTRSRFGRAPAGDRDYAAMPEARPTQLEEIRARIERGTYTVEAAKVADAIVQRLLAGRSAREANAAEADR